MTVNHVSVHHVAVNHVGMFTAGSAAAVASQVAAALLLSGRANLDGLDAMKDILIHMGTYFQVQVRG